MCGIFAYIGKKNNAAEIIFNGLKTLEYRGYDSWGIATQNHKKIIIEKHLGKLPEKLPESDFSNHKSGIGIGHTRWATHGGVTLLNTHPHFDCTQQISVLHNGIIENYQELKQELQAKNHVFKSETDTEVLAHLLEEYTKNDRLLDAMRKTFNRLRGLNAVVAVNANNKEIIAAKNGSPLVAGIDDNNEFFLASDTAGILPYTSKIIFLKDNELISLNKHYRLYSLTTGKEIKPKVETINWKVQQGSKGSYKHFMLKEINEQPRIINEISTTYTDRINKLCRYIKKAQGTFFIGSGTAFHACIAGTYLFSKIAGRHVNTAPASEFNYLENFLTEKSLIIPLSQSGETIDVIEPLNRARQKGSKIIAITNVLGSTIYRMSNYKLLLNAGPEKAVPSTKAYLAKISVLTMLAFALTDRLNEGEKILQAAKKEIQRLLDKKSRTSIKTIANLLAEKEQIYIIGRGASYATALEGALKIKEVSYIHTEGLAGGELKHGTIALISKGIPCIVIAPHDETYDAVISNAIEIKSRGGIIFGISSRNNPVFDKYIEVKETGSPLLTHVVPLQLLAYYIAIKKGLDPDKPRNLAKSVTVK
ncbi:glutamine--fructose-6-phosphate transaminase (isomerizing) [Patescibacteria group bacterium]|nr:glutamine--fructose-6-phosphate transaminase (isomerizing) [Patescibacteria group bacterium]